MRVRFAQVLVLSFALTPIFAVPINAAPRSDGQLQIEIVDKHSGQPIPARMHLQNSPKRPVKINLPGTAESGGHFYIDGQLALPLRRGQYTFEIDAGPEYRTQNGHFEIDRHADDTKRIELSRVVDLAKEGWYGGDVDFERRPRDLPLILRAEHLQDVRTNEFATTLGLGARDSGLETRPSRFSPAPSPQPPAPKISIARTPYAWDLPIWMASGELDAIQLIHRHALREGVVDNEDDGRSRDRSLYPGRTGNGRWSETVYYHALNCGLRIPPVAGSGAGTNENPVGTNRVYVFCGDEFSPQRWWEGLEAGRVFVTNGPLLRPTVKGEPPGYLFHIDASGSLILDIGLNLATRVPIEYLEIIKNGRVEADVRLADWKGKKVRLPPVVFDDSGWFLVRAVTNNPETYQFASSGPYYVEKAGQPRVSRGSARFFLEWIDAAEARLQDMPKLDDATRQSLLAKQASARLYFEQLLSTANAD
jgi:hypothetical protein